MQVQELETSLLLSTKVFSMAEIVSKEAQKELKAGICFRLSSHNKHTCFCSLSKEAQAASPRAIDFGYK
ncbi:hypothetical protein Tco_1082375 [Tanacetum coccineum]|uniref:Uncharacterized protein n=1 Tax=Tanacetum coccineum TaxID=301880 RepID=A0ABQ5I0J0_9ASTR